MSRKWKFLLIVLSLTTSVVWLSVFSVSNDLKVISCNVGQGDATFIVRKSFEILIDGGPDNKVLDCLSKYMPFWDREIEVLILTHPQADHFTGLIGVIEHYKVGKIFANSLDSGSQSYGLLKNQVPAYGIEVVNPSAGMSVRSQKIQLDILHPSEEFLTTNLSSNSLIVQEFNSQSGVLGASDSKNDPNEFSIVTLLSFGSFRFLFTGDAGSRILDSLASTLMENGNNPINYIKISHHGSKSALSEKLYTLIDGIAVISVGKNSYGHPNEEVIKSLGDRAIRVLRTDQIGDIVVETDGKKIWVK